MQRAHIRYIQVTVSNIILSFLTNFSQTSHAGPLLLEGFLHGCVVAGCAGGCFGEPLEAELNKLKTRFVLLALSICCVMMVPIPLVYNLLIFSVHTM